MRLPSTVPANLTHRGFEVLSCVSEATSFTLAKTTAVFLDALTTSTDAMTSLGVLKNPAPV